jgi:iron(III) transport system ATP-binding protein
MSWLSLRQVTRRFGAVAAVSALDLDVERGECLALLGPSGCGKTTTLRMVAGFEDLDEGEIRAGDRLLSSKRAGVSVPTERRNFGMVFQAFAVWPHLTVRENVAFPLRIRKLPAAEVAKRTDEALRHVNLLASAEGRPDALSGGGKQRVALARALAMEPDVMLLDEPLSSLDPHFREEIRFEIKDLQRRFGFTILYVTHDQTEAMALSHRILVMRDGVAQQVGTPEEVYAAPANRFVFGFVGLSSFLDVRLDAGVDGGAARVGGQRLAFPDGAAPPPVLAAAGRAVLATRPSEIAFLAEGGLRATVRRRALLGETVDYQLDVDGQALRVQRSRHEPGPRSGETCGVVLQNPRWYPPDAGGGMTLGAADAAPEAAAAAAGRADRGR